jgi:hypothetical protein
MRRRLPIVNGSKVYWVQLEGEPGDFVITCPELDLRIESRYEGGGLARMRQLITGSGYEPSDEGDFS